MCLLPYVFAPCECSGFRRFSKSTLFYISTRTPREGRGESHNDKNLFLYTFQSTRRPREARLFGGCIDAVPVR